MISGLFKNPTDLVFNEIFITLENFIGSHNIHLKLEGCSITGSIKIKSALRMIERLELEGRLPVKAKIIESSSGNLGLALAMVCASKGYQFTCISDPNISPQTARLIKAYGAELIVVTHRDANGGYLGSRIDLIKQRLNAEAGLVWINQYENINNVEAHYLHTAPAILNRFPELDYLFVGAGTTGTLGGVSKYFREKSPHTRIIAVDSVGSVTFGTPAGKRHIPGLGTSRAPDIKRISSFDELVMIDESKAVTMCHRLARKGYLLGGSSGTVLAAVEAMSSHFKPTDCVVAISPDAGDRYIDTIYNPEWIREKFPECEAIK